MQIGDTALIDAAFTGHLDVVSVLLKRGVQVDIQNKVMRGEG